jgi:hypothetical protein
MHEVKTAEGVESARKHHVEVGGTGYVGHDRDGPPTSGFNLARDFFRVRAIDVNYRYTAASLSKSNRRCPADTGSCTCHQAELSVKPHRRLLKPLAFKFQLRQE